MGMATVRGTPLRVEGRGEARQVGGEGEERCVVFVDERKQLSIHLGLGSLQPSLERSKRHQFAGGRHKRICVKRMRLVLKLSQSDDRIHCTTTRTTNPTKQPTTKQP